MKSHDYVIYYVQFVFIDVDRQMNGDKWKKN